MVNGERHSLLPILLQLLRRQPQLLNPAELASRDDDDQVLIDLNSRPLGAKPGLRVALSLGRIKPLMATLGELYLGREHRRCLVTLERPGRGAIE